MMKRLSYSIPPFLSTAWVSDAAHATWEPRLRRLNRALVKSTLAGVADGQWQSRRLRIPGALALRAMGTAAQLGIHTTRIEVYQTGEKGPAITDLLLQKKATVDVLDAPAIPTCCQRHHRAALAAQHRETIWEAALATPDIAQRADTILLPTNSLPGLFWQKLLVNPFSYTYCHLQCPQTLADHRDLLDRMRQDGQGESADDYQEISSWPLEWSACHGICELRTPVVKLAYETDATDRNFRVRAQGECYPELGGSGIHFPYRRRKFLRISDSKSFKEGLRYGH